MNETRPPRTLQAWFLQKPRPMSRYRFAFEIGVTASYVTRLCKDNPPWPSRELMQRINEATNGYITPNDLAGVRTVIHVMTPAAMGKITSKPFVPPVQKPVEVIAPTKEMLPPKREVPVRDEHKRFITLSKFVHEMAGKKTKNWYYAHVKDPGFPQRIYLPGSRHPVLDYAECQAFLDSGSTTPPWKPKRQSRKEAQS